MLYMKVVIINKSDSTGGAAVVSRRLMEALNASGVDARMLVAERLTDDSRVAYASTGLALKAAFIRERLGIFLANGFDRSTLFKIDTCADGVDVARHPWVRQADVVCLNWVNQGMLSLRGIRAIAALGKPIVWTMHDMWNMTGVCHHAGDCQGFLNHCGDCPLLGRRAGRNDLSARVWRRKKALYGDVPVHFVAVSNWLSTRARESSLMRHADIRVIPNAFNFDIDEPRPRDCGTLRIIFGAARLDDPIKGLPILVRATQLFAAARPDLAARCQLVTFGNVRAAAALSGFGLRHRHLGPLPVREVREVYESGHIVVSTSLYETLPGTLVEGQAWGCVPVSLDHGGQGDIISHGRTGYLARWSADGDKEKAARAIAEGLAWAADKVLTEGDALRSLMLREARGRFSAESVAAAYKALFDEITGR